MSYLFDPEGEAYADLKAIGETLAMARDMLQWALYAIWPAKDSYDAFLARWETVFAIQPEATVAERQDRLVSNFRNRGTMTSDLVKAIVCRAFGSDDPADVSFTSPTAAEVVASSPDEDWKWVYLHTNLHIYHTAQTTEPDYGMAADLIEKIKPTGDTWSIGQYGRSVANTYATYGAGAKSGAYDRCCYA